jgi:Flp pilus assembly protein TadD
VSLERMVAEMVFAEMLTKEELAKAMRASNAGDLDGFVAQLADEMPKVVKQRKETNSNILEFVVTKIAFDQTNGTAAVTGCGKMGDVYEMMRLYFVKQPDGWRLYDLLIFSSSGRFTVGMAAGLTAASDGTASGARFLKASQDFAVALQHLQVGNDTAAIRGFRALLATNPPELFRRLGTLMLAVAYVRDGDAAGASETLVRLQGLESDMPTIFQVRGEIVILEDDPARAVRLYESYIKAVGDDPSVLHSMAITQLEMGKPADALESIKRALSVLPNQPDLRRTYTYAQDDLDRLKRGEPLRHRSGGR